MTGALRPGWTRADYERDVKQWVDHHQRPNTYAENEKILREYVEHDNTQRPHRALAQQPPEPGTPPPTSTIGEIRRHDRLGGPIREYYRDAA